MECLNAVAIDHEKILTVLIKNRNGTFELSVDTVALERVVHGNDLHIWFRRRGDDVARVRPSLLERLVRSCYQIRLELNDVCVQRSVEQRDARDLRKQAIHVARCSNFGSKRRTASCCPYHRDIRALNVGHAGDIFDQRDETQIEAKCLRKSVNGRYALIREYLGHVEALGSISHGVLNEGLKAIGDEEKATDSQIFSQARRRWELESSISIRFLSLASHR